MNPTTAAAAAKMTSATATAVSLVLSSCVIANAFRQKKQFYPSVVYICKSNPSMAVMYVQALVAVYLIGKLSCKLFFGTLRAAESERLIEKAWYAITETCLAFTIFKDDLSPKFVALFTLLLFLKCFHWLAEDRVDYMERTPIISYIFHLRVWSLLTILTLSDIYFVHDAYTTTMSKGPSVQLVFGFEYALLITLAANAAFKYFLHAVDVHSNTFWESKAVLLLYLEFFIGLCKALMYVLFLVIMIRTYTIPLFAFRPMYYTLRNFKKVFQDLVLSRRAIYNMNTLYKNATVEDLEAIENVCIICREDMSATAAKKLPCNHIFHTSCLRSWFQRHQTCPTCRLDILRPTPVQTNTTATPATSAASAAARAQTPSTSTTNMNNQASSSGNNTSINQGVNNNTSHYNQMPHQYQFRPFPFHQTTSDENNDNSFNNISQEQFNEMLTTILNTQQNTSSLNNTQTQSSNAHVPLLFPINMPFVGAIGMRPPQLPDNIDSLTDEELRIMEQNSREGTLARLKYLTDIKCMLDSAILMMNHYSSVHNVACFNKTKSTSDNKMQNPLDTKDEHIKSNPPSSDSSLKHDSNASQVNSPSTSASSINQEETEEQRLIRLKRLEKFNNIGNQNA